MLYGSVVALVTPFKNNEIDIPAFKDLLDWQIAEGTNGILVCGSTGESMTLSPDEQGQLIEVAVQHVNKRVPVMAGTSAIDTKQTTALTKQAEDLGADMALIVTPPYIKPSQDALYRHYVAVADSTSLPIMLYNNPGRAAINIEIDTVLRLAEVPNIFGLKDAHPNVDRATHIRRDADADFCLMSGEDATAAGYLGQGGDGCVSVTANVAPALCSAMQKAWRDGDRDAFADARNRLHALNKALFMETNPCPVKAAVHMLGKCGPELREPLTQVSEQTISHLQSVMKDLGLKG